MCKCSGDGEQSLLSKKLNSIQDQLFQRLEFAQNMQPIKVSSSLTPSKVRKMSVQQQWINIKYLNGKDCPSNLVQGYGSLATGICIQNDTSSSYISSASALPNGDYSLTESFYTGVQCSGNPSKVETQTRPSCLNSDSTSGGSTQIYSITNSIPPLPGGLLRR
jgi:Protein of unknown function (DUF3430)